MRGQDYIRIPIRGINNRMLDEQSLDGLCENIVNLKPKGSPEKPYWEPFEVLRTLRNASNTEFNYTYGEQHITDAFWQIRNFIGEYAEAPGGSLKRLLVLCQNPSRKTIDIIEPSNWTVVKTQALPLDGNYSMTCTRVNEVTVINIVRNGVPYILYYLLDDTFIPQGWPETPTVITSNTVTTYTVPEIEAGNINGIPRKTDADQYYLVTWAFRLFDGSYVRHSTFRLMTVAQGLATECVSPTFEHAGYTESLLQNEPFWESLIAGVAVFATLPKSTQLEALNDGVFFEVGFFPWIDVLPAALWPTVDDPNIIVAQGPPEKWATQRNLTVDNFTHHKYSGNVVDTYNSRLLLGGSSINFALPRVATNGTSPTIPGGPYSNYFDFHSGTYTKTSLFYDSLGNIVDPEVELWDYETTVQQWTAEFTPKSGREFKSVFILESLIGLGDNDPPGGEVDLPKVFYEATVNLSGRMYLRINPIETTFGTGLLPERAYMLIEIEIGPIGSPADETITVLVKGAVEAFGDPPTEPYFEFGEVTLENGGSPDPDGNALFHIVTIKTDSGSYKRITRQFLDDILTEATLPPTIWYPDRRATKYELVVKNGTDYELALDKKLISHPTSNYAYVMLSTPEQTYTLGTSLIAATEPDMSVNNINQWVKNRTDVSTTNLPFLFEISASFRVGNRENDKVTGFGVNVDITSEGQFGQYPLYVFTDKGVWAMEQISDPTIAFARKSPVTNYNGLSTPYAKCNAGPVIIATDGQYVYSLAGNNVERIDSAISNDPNYRDFLSAVKIGYHRERNYQEIVLSNPFYPYSFYYNPEYGFWYKGTEVFKFFFLEYPDLLGMNLDNELKDFGDKDTSKNVSWSFVTRKMVMGEPYILKRIFEMFVRGTFIQENIVPPATTYPAFSAKLIGYKDNENIAYPLRVHEYRQKTLHDARFYNNYGALHSYKVEMSGLSMKNGSNLIELDFDMEPRRIHRRRIGCIGDYFYTQPDNDISLCGDHNETGGRFTATYNSPQESVIINHNLGKFAPVMVTDLEGYVIEPTIKYDNENTVRIFLDPAVAFRVFINTSSQYYEHEQLAEIETITIDHNLNKRPSTLVLDLNGFVIWPTVIYENLNQVTIEMDVPRTFKAYFN